MLSAHIASKHKEIYSMEIESENDFSKFIIYDTNRFMEAFNSIMYNFIYDQAKRNKEVLFAEIRSRILKSKTKILNTYGDIVNNAETDQDTASNFTKFIYQQLLQAASGELIEVYDDKMFMIDSEITK